MPKKLPVSKSTEQINPYDNAYDIREDSDAASEQDDSEDDGSTDDSETDDACNIIETELITDPIISYLDL